MLKQAE